MNRLKFDPRPLILGHPRPLPNIKYCLYTTIYHIVGVFSITGGGGGVDTRGGD